MRRGGNRASLVQAVCHDPRPMHFLMWGITCSDASASELRSLQVSPDGPAPSPVFLCLVTLTTGGLSHSNVLEPPIWIYMGVGSLVHL